VLVLGGLDLFEHPVRLGCALFSAERWGGNEVVENPLVARLPPLQAVALYSADVLID